MMTRSEKVKELDALRDLLVGARVEAIDPPDAGITEAIGKFTVLRGRRRTSFHLHATELGWWIGEQKRLVAGLDGTPAELYTDFYQMADAMAQHAMSLDMEDESVFELVDDPRTRQIGFRSKYSGQQWVMSLSDVRTVALEHHRRLLETPRLRHRLAEFLWENWRLPREGEIVQ